MPFSGVDPTLLRALARHMDDDVAPLLTRQAAIALDALENHDRLAVADATAFRLTSIAAWLEDAAHDLRRRAGLVEAAQEGALWAAGLPGSVRHHTITEATAVVDAPYTGHIHDDITRYLDHVAGREAGAVIASLRAGLEDDDATKLGETITWLDSAADQPWFDSAMARVFADLGPTGAARLVGLLVSEPVQRFDHAALETLARAFAAATRGGLDWGVDEMATWFGHGETGAAQLLRAEGIDAGFLAVVVTTVGFAEPAPPDLADAPGLRRLLGPGATLWHHVGPDAADHRAVLLDALRQHLPLAISLLSDAATLDLLLGTEWHFDHGRALGRLLVDIDAHGDAIDPLATDGIRRRLLGYAADPTTTVPIGIRRAIGAVAATHIADLAFSLAVTGPVVAVDSRPGLELDPAGARLIIRLAAADVDGFNRLLIGYGSHIRETISDAGADGEARLLAVADELGALTFALAYTDREIRIEEADHAAAERLSALDVLGFLASSGVALLPGPFDDGAGFVVSRVLRHASAEAGRRDTDALESHNSWKQQMLDDLEYLVAVEMALRGLLPGLDATIDPADRTGFLYAIESVDAPLELFMAIVEAQARRQREAVLEAAP